MNAARVSQPINGSNHKRLVLFVAGNELNSRKAKSNLAKLCKEHLGGREFEVVDVLADHTKALQWKVLLTPALLVFSAGESRPHHRQSGANRSCSLSLADEGTRTWRLIS